MLVEEAGVEVDILCSGISPLLAIFYRGKKSVFPVWVRGSGVVSAFVLSCSCAEVASTLALGHKHVFLTLQSSDDERAAMVATANLLIDLGADPMVGPMAKSAVSVAIYCGCNGECFFFFLAGVGCVLACVWLFSWDMITNACPVA